MPIRLGQSLKLDIDILYQTHFSLQEILIAKTVGTINL